MKLIEALRILEQVCVKHLGTRNDHIAIEQALKLVAEAMKEKIEAQEAAKNEPSKDSSIS
jgi:imidazoleglycerol phosphate dehydratase HisB